MLPGLKATWETCEFKLPWEIQWRLMIFERFSAPGDETAVFVFLTCRLFIVLCEEKTPWSVSQGITQVLRGKFGRDWVRLAANLNWKSKLAQKDGQWGTNTVKIAQITWKWKGTSQTRKKKKLMMPDVLIWREIFQITDCSITSPLVSPSKSVTFVWNSHCQFFPETGVICERKTPAKSICTMVGCEEWNFEESVGNHFCLFSGAPVVPVFWACVQKQISLPILSHWR